MSKISKILIVLTAFCMVAAIGCNTDKKTVSGKTFAPIDSTGEELIPGWANRVAISEGNLTLNTKKSFNDITDYYEKSLRKLNAQGAVVTDPTSEESNLKWRWRGSINGQPASVSVYPLEDDKSHTIVVLY